MRKQTVFTVGLVVTVALFLLGGCSLLVKKTGLVMDGIDVGSEVLSAATAVVSKQFDLHKTDYPGYGYVNWRVQSLAHAHTYDDLNGKRVVVYRMNYEFLSESPESVVLVGGMYITDDNWVMPGYPNSTYLAFEQGVKRLQYLCHLVENDCLPGTEIFDQDLSRMLSR